MFIARICTPILTPLNAQKRRKCCRLPKRSGDWRGAAGFQSRTPARSAIEGAVKAGMARGAVATCGASQVAHPNSPTGRKLTVHFTSRNPRRNYIERRITSVTVITHLGIDPELEIPPAQEPPREIDRFERHAAACQAGPRAER